MSDNAIAVEVPSDGNVSMPELNTIAEVSVDDAAAGGDDNQIGMNNIADNASVHEAIPGADANLTGMNNLALNADVPNATAADAGNVQYIKLKVVDQASDEVHFRVKPNTLMGKIKKSYADRKGISVNSIRFLFDGDRIADFATPKTLEMVEDDVIEVFQMQIGGFK